MTRIASSLIVILAVVLGVFGGRAISAQDKYTVKVPDGLAFSEFRGYEDWPVIAISENEGMIAVIVAPFQFRNATSGHKLHGRASGGLRKAGSRACRQRRWEHSEHP